MGGLGLVLGKGGGRGGWEKCLQSYPHLQLFRLFRGTCEFFKILFFSKPCRCPWDGFE